MYNNDIVHIPAVILGLQLVFYKLVKSIHIKIGKNLRRKVSDWQTVKIVGPKQAFGAWQPFPVRLSSLNQTIMLGTVVNDDFYQTQYRLLVHAVIIFSDKTFQTGI